MVGESFHRLFDAKEIASGMQASKAMDAIYIPGACQIFVHSDSGRVLPNLWWTISVF